MEALKHDLRVLLIGLVGLLLLIFVVGLFKLILLLSIFTAGFVLGVLSRNSRKDKKPDPTS